MPQSVHISKPIKLNRDADPKYLPKDSAFFMLNNERSVTSDGILGKDTPLAGNELLCAMDIYNNDPFCILKHRSNITNEAYFGFLNPDGADYIIRVNSDGTCEIVYQGECIRFLADPKHAVEDWRVYLKYDNICAHRQGKQLIWVDGSDSPVYMLDVEASLATSSFTTPFFDRCADDCALVQMCVPEICGELNGNFIPLTTQDKNLSNKLLDVGIQVRIQHVYYDGRASEWSDISSLFFQDSKGCFDASTGFPRCIKLRVPIGNPMVDKIRFAFTTNNGQVWYLAETIEKYAAYTSQGQMWYERGLANLLNYSAADCSFDYIFCNDKECLPIDVKETSRVFNPMPREPQGMIRIKDALAFYNYIKGNCPLSESESKKIEVSLNCASIIECPDEFVNVTVRAVIHNFAANRNQYIYRFNGQAGNPSVADDDADMAFFGSVGYQSDSVPLTPLPGYQQTFQNQNRNFIAYVEGMDVFDEMIQRRAGPNFTVPYDWGVVSAAGTIHVSYFNNTAFFFQEAVIRVKKGTKGFIRLADHKEAAGIGNAQDTSTQVLGTLSSLTLYDGKANITALVSLNKEIYFDTCNVVGGSLVIDEAFVIKDLIVPAFNPNPASRAFNGYITDNGNDPIEGAEIWIAGAYVATTDHNGFYFFLRVGAASFTETLSVRVEQNCAAFSEIKAVTVTGVSNSMVSADIKIVTADNPAYAQKYILVEAAVTDCLSVPLLGVRVAITGSKYKVTNAYGEAVFKLRNYSARNRVVRAVIMNHSYCYTLTCANQCNPCMPTSANTALPACFIGGTTPLEINAGSLNTSLIASKKGLKAGGRYKYGVVVQGDCGRISSVYPITVLEGSIPTDFLNVPKTQNKTGYSFCGMSYNVRGFVPPDWGSCLKIVRSKNLNGYELQWRVDAIEPTSDGKIKLTIQSLNDYNADYNFDTNTFYEYLKGDRVEFITNGDGSVLSNAAYGLLNYQILSPYHDLIVSGEKEAPANFFNQILIEDDGKLDSVTAGGVIEIQRQAECTDENAGFFEIGVSLAIVEISGAMTVLNPIGTFTTFDTYLLNRNIGTSAPQTFESKNPSDFWGDKLNGISDVGKVHFANKFENERRFGRNIAINTPNQFNRFGDFEKTLDAPEQGDLTAMAIYDGKIGLGIGELDNFLFQVSDDFLRVGQDGIVRAASADSIISDTQPKISGIFGCQYDDIGSVLFGDGFALWVDSKKTAYVRHNFSSADDISMGVMKSWFSKKIQRTKTLNAVSSPAEEKFRWSTGFNFETNAVQLSIKTLKQPDINNSKDALLLDSETVLIEPKSGDFLTFAAYVQEAYSNIELHDAKGCAFLSVSKGNVYRHPIVPTVWNTFNGVSTDWVIGISVNSDPLKVKIALSTEVQSETMFYVSKVETDNVGFISEIPAARFSKTERKWNAAFLYNANARGGIYATDEKYAGESARGYWIKVTFVRDNTINLAYNTIDTNKQKAFSNLDMLLIKYLTSEQSGFSQNL